MFTNFLGSTLLHSVCRRRLRADASHAARRTFSTRVPLVAATPRLPPSLSSTCIGCPDSFVRVMGSWEEIEKQVTAAGEKVKTLKTGGGEKEAIDAAVADLLSLKTALTAALEVAIAAAPDDAAKEVLRAKIPPAPKPSKKDKKADRISETDVMAGSCL